MRKLMFMAAGLLFTVGVAALAANQISANTDNKNAKCETTTSCNPQDCPPECCIMDCSMPCN